MNNQRNSDFVSDDELTTITRLLQQWSGGDMSVEPQLIQALYPHIHKIARNQFKSRQASALQTTEIVNEAFMRMRSSNGLDLKDEKHFMAIMARVIRSVVVDHYRAESRQKRGVAADLLTIDRFAEVIESKDSNYDWLSIDQLLTELEGIDADAAKVVEYRIFADMTIPEVADVMAVSESTVSRNWKFARLWLLAQMQN